MSNTKASEVTLDDAMNLATGHMRAGNFRVAEMTYRDILKAVPDHTEAKYYLSLALNYTGNTAESLKMISEAVQGEDATAEMWCNYGIILFQNERLEDAVPAFDKAIEIDPNHPDTYWNKSHILWNLGRYEEAEAAARKGTELNDSRPEAWLNLGAAIVKQGRLEEAVECWEKVLELAPDFAPAYNNLGNALRDLGRIKESEEICRKALELDPNYVEAMNNLGNALYDQGKIEEAEESFRKAVAARPDYSEAHNNLCIALMQQSRYEEAVTHARYATSFRKDYADAYINLSTSLRSLGRLDEAEQAIQKAVNLRPDSAEVHMDMADVLLMKDRYGDAEVELQKAQELEPDTPRVYLKLAHVLERANKNDEALEAVDKAVELNPEMPEAYLRKGQVYLMAGRHDEAEKSYFKALKLRPNMVQVHVSLAELYQTLGDLGKSREYADSAKKINKYQPGIYLTLSKLKKFKKDEADFKTMLELDKRSDSLGLEQASALHFAMFAAYEHIGDYKKAFTYLKKGNDEKRKTVPFQKDRQSAYFESVRNAFTPDRLKTMEGKGCTSDVPIFILGMPRSGTTLTEQIISSHPDVYGAGELTTLGDLDTEFGPVNEKNCKAQGEWYVEQVRKLDPSGKAKRITDKMPGNFMRVGQIVSILPNAKIIHTRRNPIDTCLSCYKQNFARGQYWSYDLEDLAAEYNLYLELMAHWRKVLPGQFLEIDYEETVGNFEEQARMLIDFVELPWHDACLEPHKQKRAVMTASKTQVIKPIYKTSVKAWQRYEKELQPLIKGLGLEEKKKPAKKKAPAKKKPTAQKAPAKKKTAKKK